MGPGSCFISFSCESASILKNDVGLLNLSIGCTSAAGRGIVADSGADCQPDSWTDDGSDSCTDRGANRCSDVETYADADRCADAETYGGANTSTIVGLQVA